MLRVFVHIPWSVLLHQRPDRIHIKTVPRPSILKHESLLQRQLGYLAQQKRVENHLVFDVESAPENLIVSGEDVIKPTLQNRP
jgi:hypothetical protein